MTSSPETVRWSVPTLAGASAAFPATAAQVGMWVAHEMDDRPEAFLVPVVHRIEGALDVAQLESATNVVLNRHEVLHSTFAIAGNTLMLETFASTSVVLTPQALPADERELRRLIAAGLRRRWKLLGDPLLRVMFGQVGLNTHILGLFFHHAIIDSHSVALVLHDLGATFGGEPPRAAAGRYSAVGTAQDDLRDAPAHDQALERWREVLEGAPCVSRPAPLEAGSGGGNVEELEHSLTPAEAATLRTTAKHQKTTPFVVMFARLALAVSSMIGRPDVVLGTAISTRDELEWEEVVGLFADFAPVRVRSPDNPLELGAAIEQVRSQLGLALSFPSIGFAEIVAAVNPQRVPEERPLFQVYATQEQPGAMELPLPGLETTRVEVRALQYPADIGFEVIQGEQPCIRCNWDPAHHNAGTIRTLISGLLDDVA